MLNTIFLLYILPPDVYVSTYVDNIYILGEDSETAMSKLSILQESLLKVGSTIKSHIEVFTFGSNYTQEDFEIEQIPYLTNPNRRINVCPSILPNMIGNPYWIELKHRGFILGYPLTESDCLIKTYEILKELEEIQPKLKEFFQDPPLNRDKPFHSFLKTIRCLNLKSDYLLQNFKLPDQFNRVFDSWILAMVMESLNNPTAPTYYNECEFKNRNWETTYQNWRDDIESFTDLDIPESTLEWLKKVDPSLMGKVFTEEPSLIYDEQKIIDEEDEEYVESQLQQVWKLNCDKQ